MSVNVIEVRGLSKRYRVGLREKKVDTIYGQLARLIKAPLENFRQLSQLTRFDADDESVFWALKDIEFSVQQGEVLGIVGRNGAGKSTLLKVLSNITEPTSGEVIVRGRVASLLEVGTGFHPELTGRENIYMNGTILGMTKREIDRKLDEIIAFSGIERHIDTPVKFFSSGMKVRLGFSVAAHLEPEILIIDEVLAVGDIAFQKMCLGKMDAIANSGRTILFVSHNMQAVRALCSSGVLLAGGKLSTHGDLEDVIKEYDKSLRTIEFSHEAGIGNEMNRRGLGHARFSSIAIQTISGKTLDVIEYHSSIEFRLTVRVNRDIRKMYAEIMLKSGFSLEPVCSTKKIPITDREVRAGATLEFKVQVPKVGLRPGEYAAYYWLGDEHLNALDVVDNMTEPLVVVAKGDPEILGFDPSVHSGYFDLDAKLIE